MTQNGLDLEYISFVLNICLIAHNPISTVILTISFLSFSCEHLFLRQTFEGEHDLDIEVLTAVLLSCEICTEW
jgi:hypothetical protein